MGRISKLGPTDIECQPVTHYETFARNSLGVAENLTNLVTGILQKESVYWAKVDSEYYGKTTAEFLDISRQEAQTVLTLRSRGQFIAELYKNLSQREVNACHNSPVPEDLDQISHEFPLFVPNGANITCAV